jgi:tRNA-dihydrouridine synthase B
MDYCKVKVRAPFFLSPMVNFTTRAFRVQCMQYGAGLCFTEMEHARTIKYNDNIVKKIKPVKEESPCGIQLVGANEKNFLEALERTEKFFPIIDLNFGCPSKKILGSHCGAWHLRNLKKMRQIIDSVCFATKKPVTVKTRLGFDRTETTKIVEMMNKTNVCALTLHGRTAKQGYNGSAKWDEIKKAKKNATMTVVGNGDIKTAEQGYDRIENGFCDFVMIGRAALSNPLVFAKQTKTGISKKTQVKDYLRLAEKQEESAGIVKLHLMQFTKGEKGSAKKRELLTKAKTIEEMKKIILSSQ